MLTLQQQRVHKFICDYVDRSGGVAPTYKEMSEGSGIASRAQLWFTLACLEEKGFIKVLRNRARGIEILRRPEGIHAPSLGDVDETLRLVESYLGHPDDFPPAVRHSLIERVERLRGAIRRARQAQDHQDQDRRTA